MRKLPVVCAQLYEGTNMRVTPCTRCNAGWNRDTGMCDVHTGAEGLPSGATPECPLQKRCQHQLQVGTKLCAVRRAGLICESALVAGGMSHEEAANHPLSFNAGLYS